MRWFSLLLPLLLCLCSCYTDPGKYHNGPVVVSYTDASLTAGDITQSEGTITVAIALSPENAVVYKKGDKRYEDLCDKHNDFFRGYLTHTEEVIMAGDCYARDFCSLEITCSTSIDASHPAGSSLADITEYYAHSCYRWIQSDYSSSVSAHIKKPVSALTSEDLKMIQTENFIHLVITGSLPVDNDVSFIITLITDEGEVIKVTSYLY